MSEEALKRVLARLKSQGWAVAMQDLPSEPSPPIGHRPKEAAPRQTAFGAQIDELVAMPLNVFANRSLIFHIWSRVLDGEAYFVSGEAQVKVLLERGIGRGKIYTAKELMTLIHLPGIEKAKLKRILEAKELFDGVLWLENTR